MTVQSLTVERDGLYPIAALRGVLGAASRWIISSTTALSVFLCVISLALLDVVSGGLVGVVLMRGSLVKGEPTQAMTIGIYTLSFALSVASTGVQKALWDMVIRGKVPRGWWIGVILLIVTIASLDTVADTGFGAMVLAGIPLAQFPQALAKVPLVPLAVTALWSLSCLTGELLLAVLLFHLADDNSQDGELSMPTAIQEKCDRMISR